MFSTGSKVAVGVAVPVGIYAVVLGALLTPYLQRFSLYAHKINTLFYHDIDNAEQFGFAKNQVTPFYIRTPDGETLYAWHVLPLDVYARNEKTLREQPSRTPTDAFTETEAFRLLTSKDARVIVSYDTTDNSIEEVHGNAGHVAQGYRTDMYHRLTTQPNTHLITIDYRGFGKSTGSPTEAGLIIDGVAIVNWVLDTAKIPPERIVLLGQSLGTAVASAVALQFANPDRIVAPGSNNDENDALLDSQLTTLKERTTFAGIVLVAPFSNLPSLLLTYRIGGFLPVLMPLRPFGPLAKLFTSQMVDKWPTADRLAAYYSTLTNQPKLFSGSEGRSMGSVRIIHATNDRDISYHQTEMICRRMFGDGEKCIDGSKGAAVLDVKRDGRPRVRFEVVECGGHNRIVTWSHVSLAILRAFDDTL